MLLKLNVNVEEAAKLQKLLEDEVFADALIAMQTPEEVQEALKEKGVNISIEEIMGIAKQLNAASADELDENSLENVAGGALVNVYWDYKKGKLNVTVVW